MTFPDAPQPSVSGEPRAFPVLPVRAGTPAERGSIDHLRAWAGSAARVDGCVGDAEAGAVDAAHTVLGAAATAALGIDALATAGFAALAVLTLSALARLGGYELVGAFVPRRPAWNLRVGRPGPATRYVLAVAADRAAPRAGVREASLLALSVSLLAASLGPWSEPALVPGLPVVGLLVATAFGWARTRGAPTSGDFPEARAVAAALQSLARAQELGRDDVAGVVCSAAAESGAGVAGFLDWWAVDRGRAVVVWVDGSVDAGMPVRGGPLDRLRRAGWRVVVARIPSGDRDGMGVDREWLVG